MNLAQKHGVILAYPDMQNFADYLVTLFSKEDRKVIFSGIYNVTNGSDASADLAKKLTRHIDYTASRMEDRHEVSNLELVSHTLFHCGDYDESEPSNDILFVQSGNEVLPYYRHRNYNANQVRFKYGSHKWERLIDHDSSLEISLNMQYQKEGFDAKVAQFYEHHIEAYNKFKADVIEAYGLTEKLYNYLEPEGFGKKSPEKILAGEKELDVIISHIEKYIEAVS